LKITTINVRPITIRYKADFTTAYGTERETKHALVQIKTDDDLAGLGEAAPLTDFTGENYRTVEYIITREFADRIVGLDPFDHSTIHSRLDEVLGNNAAKAAVDIALYDLMGKKVRFPVYRLLGGRFRNRIETAEVIGADTPEAMAKAALDLKRQGFRTIKMKVRADRPKHNAERVAAVRDAVGDKVNLRIDANNSLPVDTAVEFGRKVRKYGIEYLEQPVNAKNLKGLAKVRKATGIPVAADEACHTAADALQVIRHEAADVLCIKFAKCGGICEAKMIADLASAASLKCVVISAFEVGVGVAADVHVALSSPSIELPCEIAIGPEYDDEYTTGLRNGMTWLDVPDAAGLGVELVNQQLFNEPDAAAPE
jgi:o-succinylbenzoate synthase